MNWSYRIIKENGEYTVREYFEKFDSWTADEVSPAGETRDEMRQSITNYINDITTLPILIVEKGEVIGEEPPIKKITSSE